jgi:hypothetical protein
MKPLLMMQLLSLTMALVLALLPTKTQALQLACQSLTSPIFCETPAPYGAPFWDAAARGSQRATGFTIEYWGSDGPAAMSDGAEAVRLRLEEGVANKVLNLVLAEESGALEVLGYSNYRLFWDRSELRLFHQGDSLRKEPLDVVATDAEGRGRWTRPAGLADAPLVAVWRVYDAQGQYDETLPVPFSPDADINVLRSQLANDSRLARSKIAVAGSRIVVEVDGMSPGTVLKANGQRQIADDAGRSIHEVILPPGEHEIVLRLERPDGSVRRLIRSVRVAESQGFFIGLANLTMGARNLAEAIETTGPDSDIEKGYIEGRLAFFYRGRIRGDALLTAFADSGDQEIDELFSRFDEKDPRSFLRRIDPDRHYAVYGDDSITEELAPSSGNLYLRLERGDDSVTWGNFQTRQSGNSLTTVNRSLYGLQVVSISDAHTGDGEPRAGLSVYAAEPGTIARYDRLRATGGATYYLSRQDVARGSERVFVEVRDRESNLVLERRELRSAVDYDINYIQGRLSLRRPLASTASTRDGVVRDGVLAGHPQFLVLSYEYIPDLFNSDALSAGGAARFWLNDHLALGISAARQGEAEAAQTLAGVDLLVQKSPSSYLRVETARSDGPGADAFASGNGGLDFDPLTAGLVRTDARATRVEFAVAPADFGRPDDVRLGAVWQKREAGFAAPGEWARAGDEEQANLTLAASITARYGVEVDADYRGNDQEERSTGEARLRHDRDDGVYWSAGLRHDHRRSTQRREDIADGVGVRQDLSVEIGRDRADAPLAIYGFAQATLSQDDTRGRNDRVGAGGRVQVLDQLSFEGEVSDGNQGLATRVGAQLDVSERSSVYLNYDFGGETPDAFRPGEVGRLTSGLTTRYGDSLGVFAEARYDHGEGPTGLVQTYGLDFTPGDRWAYGATWEEGALESEGGGLIERRAATASASFQSDVLRSSALLEWREDADSQRGTRDIFAWRLNGSYQVTPGLRSFAKLNGSTAQAREDPAEDAEFLEAVVAAAYRPVTHDRLNLLARLTYLEDLPPAGQTNAGGALVSFAQRSTVAAVDASWRVGGPFTLGAKFALRVGELQAQDAMDNDWFDSQARLLAVRGDLQIMKRWNGLIEWRRLDADEAGDAREGALIVVDRHIGDHARLGLGYNFTRFSDDLTDLAQDEDGVFLNLVAIR